jgi:hypothetical protein
MRYIENISRLLFFLFLLIGNQSCSQIDSVVGIYIYENDVLSYQKVNISTNEVKQVNELRKLDVFEGYQKGEFFILNSYDNTLQSTFIYRNGQLLRELNRAITEFQLSSIPKNDEAVVIDATDLSQIEERYSNRLFVYLADQGTLGNILLSSDKVESAEDTGNIRYIFYPYSFPQTPSSKHWSYTLQIIDLKSNKIMNFDTIEQSNFNLRDGFWEFVPSHSFWKSDNEVTYLLYKPYEEKIKLKIMGYKIDVGEKEELFEFEIPNEAHTIDLNYWIENNTVYLSNGETLYRVKNDQLTTVHKSKAIIAGFHF